MSPTLTMLTTDPCPLCGYEVSWFRVAGYRINKKTLRQTTPGIGASAYPRCPECGSSVRRDTYPLKWWLAPEDEKTVNEVRARRWPA